MPTNDERREVAENLRTMTMRGCRYKEEFYDLLNETVMNEWDFHSFSDVAERLADLIEPEERTCRVHNLGGLPHSIPILLCDSCGSFNYAKADGSAWNYCPSCGEKVVSE